TIEVLGLTSACNILVALEAAYSNASVERIHSFHDSLRQLTEENCTGRQHTKFGLNHLFPIYRPPTITNDSPPPTFMAFDQTHQAHTPDPNPEHDPVAKAPTSPPTLSLNYLSYAREERITGLSQSTIEFFMLTINLAVNCFLIYPRSCKCNYRWTARNSGPEPKEKLKRDSLYIDKQGKLRSFNHKKVSRKRGGSLRGQGWKYGSGFVDGIFPVLSTDAQQILNFMKKETDLNRVCQALSSLSPTHTTWDDIISVAVQLRLNKRWDPIILKASVTCLMEKQGKNTPKRTYYIPYKEACALGRYFIQMMCEWILYRSTFQPDIICYNLLIDAFGQKSCADKAESTYLNLLEARCIPTEDTYALLLRAYCTCGLLEKAEAVFMEMRKHGLSPSAVVYNAYIDGLMKGRNSQKAVEIFQRMKRDCCQPSTDTYTMLINLYGKANRSYMALKVFHEMRSQKCKPNICTYTALINAFAREGLCEKAEDIFEQLQEAGLEPDVYAYNALMEAYSRAGFPYGAAEIFSLMQHMGCEPDRASFNIMVDAYGRSGLHEDARLVFEEMKRLGIEPTMKSHMVLLSAYSKVGNVSKCEELVTQMHKSGLEPDTFVLNTMINVYGRMGHFRKMEEVLAVMENRPYVPDISTYNILINMYGRAGYFERMEEIFRLLPAKNLQRDVVTWTSRLGAYSRKKLYTRCLEIFEEMITHGCYPDGGTARVLLSACSTKEQIFFISGRGRVKGIQAEEDNIG
ncbi:Pentatricopeptide repeat-containing protein, partial [Cynara cardunculus var. scolymus]